MCTGRVRGWIFIFAYFVVAVNPSSARSLDDESIFSDTFTPLDSSTPSTDQSVISPLDQVALPSFFDTARLGNPDDTSDQLFSDQSEDENEASSVLNPSLFDNNNIILADSPKSGSDCSPTSELFLSPAADPSIGKSRRARGLDNANADSNSNSISNSEICPLPSKADSIGSIPNSDGFPDLPGLQRLRVLPDWNTRVRESALNKNHNSLCYVYFQGIFPWGVCSSGDIYDVQWMEHQYQHWEMWGLLKYYKIQHGTLGTFCVLFFSFAPSLPLLLLPSLKSIYKTIPS